MLSQTNRCIPVKTLIFFLQYSNPKSAYPLFDTGVGEISHLLPSSPEHCELWLALIQKAYAKLHGGYSALNESKIQEVLVDLTGGVCEKWKLEGAKMQEDAKSGMRWSWHR